MVGYFHHSLLAVIAALGLAGCATVSAPPAPVVATQPNVIFPIVFPTNSAVLSPAHRETVQGIASLLRYHGMTASLIGKTDTVGSAEYNQWLSERRAEAVHHALIKDHAPSSNIIETHWTGFNHLVVPTPPNTPMLQNRVVEVFVR